MAEALASAVVSSVIGGIFSDSGGGGGAPSTALSPEQRALLQQQSDALALQQQILRSQLGQVDLLSPMLWQMLGITPQYSAGTAGTAPNVLTPAQQAQAAALQGQISSLQSELTQGTSPNTAGPLNADQQTQLQGQITALTQQLATLQGGAAGTRPQLTGFTRNPPSGLQASTNTAQNMLAQLSLGQLMQQYGQQRQQGQITDLLGKRTLAALKGELPVNPALLHDLATQEQTLKETLRSNLGPGWATSSPGIEAMASFDRTRNETLESARRGDIALGEQLGSGERATTAAGGLQFMPLANFGQGQLSNTLSNIFNVNALPLQLIPGLSNITTGASTGLDALSRSQAAGLQYSLGQQQLGAASNAGVGQFFGMMAPYIFGTPTAGGGVLRNLFGSSPSSPNINLPWYST